MTASEVVQKWAKKPFSYGADCCQFAGEVVQSWTGLNPMEAFDYKNKAQALRVIASHGGLEGALRDTLGPPSESIPSDRAVLLCRQVGAMDIVGVAINGRCVVRTANSVTDWPLEAAHLAWAV